MRRLFLMSLFITFVSFSINAQSIMGTVKDKDTNKALSGVEVSIKGTTLKTLTNSVGFFELKNVPSKSLQVSFLLKSYERAFVDILLKDGQNKDLGNIFLKKVTAEKDNSEDIVVELSTEEIDSGDDGLDMNVSGVLHGSKDLFMSTAGYTFGPLRFNVRGYDNKYSSLSMNGLETNDMESGRAVWAYWGGLNDAVRNKETYKGVAETDFTFGDVGGITGINTRASDIRVGTKFTYSFTNRSYNHRAMFIHSTGMMKNGLAVAVSGSRRFAEEGYTAGTFYDAWSYFASIEKKFNDKHSLGLVAFGAPSKRGGRSATTQEVYDLTSEFYNGYKIYNPNWGWQDGKKRNAKVTDSHTPMAILTHYWTIDNSSKLQTSFAYSKGKYNKTSLNWYNAADPRPDYYRYLPSNFPDSDEDSIFRANEFINGERQIDWDAMYQTNYRNIDTILNADNITGNTLIGKRSQYIVENRMNENSQFWFNTVYNKLINDDFKVTFGASHRRYKARHYKTLVDLLGGDYVVDIDKYAERDLSEEGVAESDIRYPNHIVDEIGEVFGNDYYANVNKTQVWGQTTLDLGKVNTFFSLEGSNTNMWRTGNMQNGKFPDNSLGNSEVLKFYNYGIKAGATYKISGMHFLHLEGINSSKAPDFRNTFVSPRTRNQIVDGLKSEKILSVQGGYVLQSNKLKASFDLFYTTFDNQTSVRSFYFDGYRSFVNFVTTDIDKTHKGIEFAAEYSIIPGLSVYGVGSLGYYRWDSRPNFSVYVDNSASVEFENEPVYVKDFLVSGTPQTAFAGGIKYWAPKHWFLGVNATYMDNRYLAFSNITRTIDAVATADHSAPEFIKMVEQDPLASSFTLDASLGKSFRFQYKYYLNINLNVTNLLNNKNIVTGGYEQARIDQTFENYDKFQPKLYYYSGLQYYLNVSFRF